jgi:phosphatidylserine decarboxylase
MNIILILFGLVSTLFIWWRFWFFIRNPKRQSPAGAGFLAPADGYVVYVKRVDAGEIPITIKNRTRIELFEISSFPELDKSSGYLIGTFMTAFSVHHNRVPLSGELVFKQTIRQRTNQTTARLMTNILLKRMPLEENCSHIIENERVTIGIKTTKGVYSLTQIADKWISHIINRVSTGDQLSRGELFGMIRFGSQVDVFIPDELGYTPSVSPGDYVLAGVTILATPLAN